MAVSSLRCGSIYSVGQGTNIEDTGHLSLAVQEQHISSPYAYELASRRSIISVAAYHRVSQCFRWYGNAKHCETMKEVSLAECEAYVRARHGSMVWKRMKVYQVGSSDFLY